MADPVQEDAAQRSTVAFGSVPVGKVHERATVVTVTTPIVSPVGADGRVVTFVQTVPELPLEENTWIPKQKGDAPLRPENVVELTTPRFVENDVEHAAVACCHPVTFEIVPPGRVKESCTVVTVMVPTVRPVARPARVVPLTQEETAEDPPADHETTSNENWLAPGNPLWVFDVAALPIDVVVTVPEHVAPAHR